MRSHLDSHLEPDVNYRTTWRMFYYPEFLVTIQFSISAEQTSGPRFSCWRNLEILWLKEVSIFVHERLMNWLFFCCRSPRLLAATASPSWHLPPKTCPSCGAWAWTRTPSWASSAPNTAAVRYEHDFSRFRFRNHLVEAKLQFIVTKGLKKTFKGKKSDWTAQIMFL